MRGVFSFGVPYLKLGDPASSCPSPENRRLDPPSVGKVSTCEKYRLGLPLYTLDGRGW